jgi:hypothetical protein
MPLAIGLLAASAASAVPVNDDIDAAIALPVTAGSLIGTTVEATPTAGLPTFANGIDNEVWYSFVGTGGSLTFDTLSPITDFDTQILIYSGHDGVSVSSLSLEVENDDAAGTFQSRVTLNSAAGVAYLLAVDGFAGEEGTFELSFPDTGAVTCEVALPGALALLLSALGLAAGLRRLA